MITNVSTELGCQSNCVFSWLVLSVSATTNVIGVYFLRLKRFISFKISVVWPPEPSTTIVRTVGEVAVDAALAFASALVFQWGDDWYAATEPFTLDGTTTFHIRSAIASESSATTSANAAMSATNAELSILLPQSN